MQGFPFLFVVFLFRILIKEKEERKGMVRVMLEEVER